MNISNLLHLNNHLFIKKVYNSNLNLTVVLLTSLPASFVGVHNAYAEKMVDVEPFVSMNLGYSDNIGLESSDQTGSFYTEVSPGIRISREGARVKTFVDYSMQGVAYSNTDDKLSNTVNNNLNSNLSAELWEERLFVDMNAGVTQELLDSRKSASDDNVAGSENLTDTYTYAIRPSWRGRWGDWAKSVLSYEYDEVMYESDGDEDGDDSKGHNASLSIDSGKIFRSFFWNVNLGYKRVDYQNDDDSHSNTSLLTLGYRITPKVNIRSYAGYEEYHEVTNDRYDSNYGVGLTWAPSRKTFLEFSFGHRFYGDSYEFSFRRALKTLNVNLKYTESITDTRSQIKENNDLSELLGLAIGEETISPEDAERLATLPLNSANNSLYVAKQLNGQFDYQNKKSRYALGMFYETRRFDDPTNNEKNYGLDLSWELTMGRRMTAESKVSWQHNQFEKDSTDSDEWELSWALKRRLSRKMTGNLYLGHRHKNASISDDEFDELRMYVSVMKSF